MSQNKEKILVSACLLGVNCRYDGKNGKNDAVLGLMEEFDLIPVCPEQLGGMETPRKPSERQKGEGAVCVKNSGGEDVTDYYRRGAEETLKLARLYGCRYAVLKERSPSCGSGVIYDGTFSGNKIPGDGVTAELLKANGIVTVGESGIEELRMQIAEPGIPLAIGNQR